MSIVLNKDPKAKLKPDGIHAEFLAKAEITA
jgi:hypothetical protein